MHQSCMFNFLSVWAFTHHCLNLPRFWDSLVIICLKFPLVESPPPQPKQITSINVATTLVATTLVSTPATVISVTTSFETTTPQPIHIELESNHDGCTSYGNHTHIIPSKSSTITINHNSPSTLAHDSIHAKISLPC